MSERNSERLKVRGVKRDEPDLRRLARALIRVAIEQARRADAANGGKTESSDPAEREEAA